MPTTAVSPVTGGEAVRRALEEALGVEKEFEQQLRAFSTEGDDDEVKQAFAEHAEETRHHSEGIGQRLMELGGVEEAASTRTLTLTPRTVQIAHAAEERLVQNLMAAYTAEAGECALYEVLIGLARAAGDQETTALARSIQTAAHRAADKFWSFLPSRSIIAYNILTIGEIDPAVETKVGEVSWTQ